ncbi:caskin-1-like [Cyclospora cayetanensis]|uniref:Caskin-1-like n=1 Tax=Cyclospora cayetanensis TaxID=88456 RepID=A0A6P6RUI1_9EIME|nr:caskin-1-like [Cyclospora cayetanensis]
MSLGIGCRAGGTATALHVVFRVGRCGGPSPPSSLRLQLASRQAARRCLPSPIGGGCGVVLSGGRSRFLSSSPSRIADSPPCASYHERRPVEARRSTATEGFSWRDGTAPPAEQATLERRPAQGEPGGLSRSSPPFFWRRRRRRSLCPDGKEAPLEGPPEAPPSAAFSQHGSRDVAAAVEALKGAPPGAQRVAHPGPNKCHQSPRPVQQSMALLAADHACQRCRCPAPPCVAPATRGGLPAASCAPWPCLLPASRGPLSPQLPRLWTPRPLGALSEQRRRGPREPGAAAAAAAAAAARPLEALPKASGDGGMGACTALQTQTLAQGCQHPAAAAKRKSARRASPSPGSVPQRYAAAAGRVQSSGLQQPRLGSGSPQRAHKAAATAGARATTAAAATATAAGGPHGSS